MIHCKLGRCALALLLCTLVLPVWAASSTLSSASEGVSTSVGSSSTSLETSSRSSRANDDVAQGEYRLVDIDAVPERPATVRLTLQALASPGPSGAIRLHVPPDAVAQGRLEVGTVVTAWHRPYGIEFAAGEASGRRAFFLALDEAWLAERQTRAVAL